MIHLNSVSKQYGSTILFRGANFQLEPHSRTGLVGANGSGKTTVFRLIAGEEHPDDGEVIKPKRAVIGYFSQDVGDMAGRSALEEVMAERGFPFYDDAVEAYQELGRRLGMSLPRRRTP